MTFIGAIKGKHTDTEIGSHNDRHGYDRSVTNFIEDKREHHVLGLRYEIAVHAHA
uniref:Uncharacterized protein n=1 Tax=Arundo donax TaxID=35708 RepID=A0A0A8YTV2_ARUDO